MSGVCESFLYITCNSITLIWLQVETKFLRHGGEGAWSRFEMELVSYYNYVVFLMVSQNLNVSCRVT